MAYNLKLAERIRTEVQGIPVLEKKMFGGVGYMLNGNLCFGIHKEWLLIRTTPEKADELLKSEYFSPFDITGKPMKGWLLVSPDAVETEEDLLKMLQLGVDLVKTLDKKK